MNKLELISQVITALIAYDVIKEIVKPIMDYLKKNFNP